MAAADGSRRNAGPAIAADALAVAQRYFGAWNRRGPDRILALFADGGTYRDPATGGELAGPAIAAYAAGLFATFPDLSFEVVSASPAGDGRVVAEWLMGGTNSGVLAAKPPTGRAVSLLGVEVIEVEGDRIRSVRGYFDRKSFLEQLGLQILAQPYSMGPLSFGTSIRLTTGKRTRPGAFSLTWLEAPTQAERDQARAFTDRMFSSLAAMPGFIGLVLTSAGDRMMTLSAWEDRESPRQILGDGAHKEAMAWFFGSVACTAAWTSVWALERGNALWVRCPACGQMANHDRGNNTCACGASLPEPPPYR